MAKVNKYVPQTKYPKSSVGAANIFDKAGYKLQDLFRFLAEKNAKSKHSYFTDLLRHWQMGNFNEQNFEERYSQAYRNRIKGYVFSETKEFKDINDNFLKEFDNRSDLLEIYEKALEGRRYVYDIYNGYTPYDHPEYPKYEKRPESYEMFESAITRSDTARQMIELARETPYAEGDLVMLRDTAVDTQHDPMFVPRWKRVELGDTPDKSVPRIGTVISVTEKLSGYYARKGDKVIKVVWMGVGDGKVVEVSEKHIKWHMRPTYANGMKTRA